MTGKTPVLTKFRAFAAALTLLVSVYAGAAFFGVDLPRPAMSAELKTIGFEVVLLRIQVTERELESETLRYYQNRREQKSYQKRGERVPDFLLEEQATLEVKKKRLESELGTLRERAANGK